jgi:hypothetical protein
MPTRTASETSNTQDRQELQRAVKRYRHEQAEELEAKAIEQRDATLRTVKARLRNLYPTAPESTIQGWLQVDADYLAAVERHEAARWDLHEIENSDHGSIQPSKVETAVAELDCSRRRRSWSTFMRQLDRETRRRHALRKGQQVPTGSTGRQSRPSTSTRTRGSKRTATSSSSSGGGDSGSSGDSDPAGLAHTGRETHTERYCRGCGLRLVGYAPQARDHGPACTTRWRRRGKVAAEPVDGVEYGPGVRTAAEIEQAIERRRAGVRYLHEQVTSYTEVDEVLELVEQAIRDRRTAWRTGDSRSVGRLDYDLDRLWALVRERKIGSGDPVYRRAPGRRLHG